MQLRTELSNVKTDRKYDHLCHVSNYKITKYNP
jgi:hypothetical protein